MPLKVIDKYNIKKTGIEKTESFFFIVTNFSEESMALTHKRCDYFPCLLFSNFL